MILKVQAFLSNLGVFVTTLIRLTLLTKFKVNLAKPKAEDVVILGNGPSFKKMVQEHRSFINTRDIFCVNHFPSTEYYEAMQPKFYITSAPDLWLDDIDTYFVDQSNRLFNTMAEKTTWPLIFYIPFEAGKFNRWKNILARNPNIEIRYYNNTPIEGWKWFRHFCFDAGWGMPRPHNVMIPSLMVTLNMGYKTIYLWGADHSWLSEISINDQNQVLINQKHFYDEQTSVGKPLDKRGVGSRNLPELLTKFVHAFNGYFVIKKYAQSRQATIWNNTPNSFIDAFDRMDLSDNQDKE